jgi:uncharacterized protein (UPF0210 family)
MANVTVRTVTVGIPEPHPIRAETLQQAAAILAAARTALEDSGYEVQTTRVAMRPVFEDMASATFSQLERYGASLQRMCDEADIAFCSLGPVPASDPAFPLTRLDILPSLLTPNPALSAAAQIATVEHGVRADASTPVARMMHTLGLHGTGEANFRFAALALCEPGGPFFPQAYHRGADWTASVGLQSAGLIGRVIAEAATTSNSAGSVISAIPPAVERALTREAKLIAPVVEAALQESSVTFNGFDLSPAPMGMESIAEAFESAGMGMFGEPGTLAIATAITAGIRSVQTLTCGYNGLMLPVLEDATIGERAAEGKLTVTSLLAYSAVCGTGLDTVPIPAETPPERVAALLLDMASLAYRLRKPLSARLFLVPGARPGDMTQFATPYLTNTRVMAL